MYSFNFENITSITSFDYLINEDFEKGVFIWIWYANKIPPHIGISFSGKYYSLKVNGKDMRIPVHKIKNLIELKKIGTFVVQLDVSIKHSVVEEVFKNYKTAASSQTTCLKPICQLFDFEKENAILADLLNYFEQKEFIREVFSINLEQGFSGILKYGKKEIEERLIHLENAKRGKSISQSR